MSILRATTSADKRARSAVVAIPLLLRMRDRRCLTMAQINAEHGEQ